VGRRQAASAIFCDAISNEEQARYLADETQYAKQDLSKFAARSGLGECRQIVRHDTSTAPHQILQAAAEEKADLIAISTHGRSGLTKLLIGSATEQVFKSPTIDVLAVPPSRGG
jgi:nucleotide-binding universal stress UspA family protein